MMIILQFPISDARSFDRDRNLRLALPDWPNPNANINPQFVNRFGRARRSRESDIALPDEFHFCLAKRALRFVELERCRAGRPRATFRPQCEYRRFFFDGRAVARVEICLRHHVDAPNLTWLNGHEVLAIVSELCKLPTNVPQAASMSPRRAELICQGRALARLFALSSISRDLLTDKRARARHLVEEGNPLLLVELAPDESRAPLVPAGFIGVPASTGVDLAFGRLRVGRAVVPTWIFQPSNPDSQNAENLRVCLLRLHAEQEVLDLILKQIARHRILDGAAASWDWHHSAAVDRINDYFNKATKLIKRAKWGGIDQSAILSAFDAAAKMTPPANRRNMIDRFEGTRRQIASKLKDYSVRRESVRTFKVTTVNNRGTRVKEVVSRRSTDPWW